MLFEITLGTPVQNQSGSVALKKMRPASWAWSAYTLCRRGGVPDISQLGLSVPYAHGVAFCLFGFPIGSPVPFFHICNNFLQLYKDSDVSALQEIILILDKTTNQNRNCRYAPLRFPPLYSVIIKDVRAAALTPAWGISSLSLPSSLRAVFDLFIRKQYETPLRTASSLGFFRTGSVDWWQIFYTV